MRVNRVVQAVLHCPNGQDRKIVQYGRRQMQDFCRMGRD